MKTIILAIYLLTPVDLVEGTAVTDLAPFFIVPVETFVQCQETAQGFIKSWATSELWWWEYECTEKLK